ncbi:TPA: hypothetical protein QCI64_001506 [Enterobacter asburiae]|nr:hypothetical protein [Enterobacter asburiae]HCR2018652.1 hypothetical protein [Enterobacter asburiae]HCR2025529.1 hypothetical protein [Enterobacter asburiae]HCR2035197.1 hypothetical protein [Enterobacter asburiae]HCR2039313.1 hypothetical protein [Enterobacter asburiae]
MATLNLTVVAQRRWWVMPLLSVIKGVAYARFVRERHLEKIADFIAQHGFTFKKEK